MAADLHVHTTASDGSLEPEQVVARAYDLGLNTIAITDHDTVRGIPRALRAGRSCGVKVIPGVELSTALGQDGELHILGLFINYQDALLNRVLAELRLARKRRIKKMTKRVKELGLEVSWQRVKEIANKGAIGRPHLAQALVEGGYVSSVSEAFAKYIGRGCPAYLPRPKLEPKEAIRLIRQAQGIPILAHPGWLAWDVVRDLVAGGLMGLEVFYPQHDLITTRRLYRMTKGWHLLLSGGSDYHGIAGTGNELGVVSISDEHVLALQDARHLLQGKRMN